MALKISKGKFETLSNLLGEAEITQTLGAVRKITDIKFRKTPRASLKIPTVPAFMDDVGADFAIAFSVLPIWQESSYEDPYGIKNHPEKIVEFGVQILT